jgi:hypothetical protein
MEERLPQHPPFLFLLLASYLPSFWRLSIAQATFLKRLADQSL